MPPTAYDLWRRNREEVVPRFECETLGIEHVCPASPRRLAWTDYRPAEPETWVRIPAGASSSRPRQAISKSVASIWTERKISSLLGVLSVPVRPSDTKS